MIAEDSPAAVEAPSPPRVLTALYAIVSVVLFALYAYTLWTYQRDPGRVAIWLAHVRNSLSGAN